MSEFTDGIVFRPQHRTTAEAALANLKQSYIVEDLNDAWMALYVEQPSIRAEPLRGWLIETSASFPLMWFEHAEDHGWTYRIFHEGHVVAAVEVRYEMSFNMALDVFEARYPGEDPFASFRDGKFRQINEEVSASDAYRNRFATQYKHANADAFKVFDVAETVIDRLRDILTAEWYFNAEQHHQQVYMLKDALNLRELQWKSYRYLSRDDAN